MTLAQELGKSGGRHGSPLAPPLAVMSDDNKGGGRCCTWLVMRFLALFGWLWLMAGADSRNAKMLNIKISLYPMLANTEMSYLLVSIGSWGRKNHSMPLMPSLLRPALANGLERFTAARVR